VPTDASAYKRAPEDAVRRVSEYKLSNKNDKTVDILKAFIEHLPREGAQNVSEDVLQCGSDEEIEKLARNLVTGLLMPSIYPLHLSIFHIISL
jgi:hypothetical protein